MIDEFQGSVSRGMGVSLCILHTLGRTTKFGRKYMRKRGRYIRRIKGGFHEFERSLHVSRRSFGVVVDVRYGEAL